MSIESGASGTHDCSPDDALPRAYEERTAQLHDARTALAEAVSMLRAELVRRTQERDEATAENQALREQLGRLEAALAAAQLDIRTLQQMKVVRWTAWPRRIRYGLRSRQS
ncbi:MAG: hypothetical protein ACXVH3_01295 [Solirubrobacteraceae bacterium]